MNSNTQTTFLIAGILVFALMANVSAPSVFATGGLDDEEEEEAIEQLQNTVEEIKEAIGTIELNLTEGTNHIDANCPSTEEIVQEVVENITAEEPPQQPPCPIITPVQQNVTEVIEEIIENVTEVVTPSEPPQCPFAPKEIIPDIVLPNISEPVEPQCPQPPPPPPPPPTIVPEPPAVEPECPPTNNNTTDTTNNDNNNNSNNLTDGQEIATIEFDASCSCFVVDKTPAAEEVVVE